LLAGVSILLLFAAFGERSLWVVLFAVVLFGYVLKPLGLVLAVFVLTIVSAVPGFVWTRKDFQMLPAYAAVGVLLTYLTLLVSSWIQHPVLAVFGAVGLSLPPVLVLLLVEIGLGAALAFFAGRYKWPQITAGTSPCSALLLRYSRSIVRPRLGAADERLAEPLGVSAMELFHNLAIGFQVALTFQNIFYCLMGCLLGTLIGVLPGIGPVATIAMLLPVTFTLNPTSALIMLAGIYYGAQYGGSTTAILVNIPGESSSVVTCLDGYQMARQGGRGPRSVSRRSALSSPDASPR